MKVIEKFADEVISSGAYKPLDRVYVINKIRGWLVIMMKKKMIKQLLNN